MVEPKYQIKWTSQYKKDIKLAKKRHYKIEELQKELQKYKDQDTKN